MVKSLTKDRGFDTLRPTRRDDDVTNMADVSSPPRHVTSVEFDQTDNSEYGCESTA